MTRRSPYLARSFALPTLRTRLSPFLLRMLIPVALAVALLGSALGAQTANRVTQRVDATRVRLLPSHHPLWADAANDAGALPPDRMLDRMTLVLSRSPEQQQAFEDFLADQQDPASPEYHQWLTPSEVGDRFGLSEQDVASVTAWLQSQGLHVNWIPPSRIFIGFGGTAADLGRALHTELHSYSVNGTQRFSVSSDPMIPEALAPAIKAIRGLYTLEEHPLHIANSMPSDSAQATTTNGSHFIAPGDFATIYDLPAGISGSGQSIGVLGRSRTNFADFANFRLRTGSNFPNPTEIVPTAFGGQDPGPPYTSPPSVGSLTGEQSEATLDVTRAGSVAPSASLLLVVASIHGGGIEAGAQYLVQTSPVPVQVMTISYGACESSAGPSDIAFWDTIFQQGAAEGISSFVSSGDSGASGCDMSFQTPPANPQPNSPNYLCASSYVTCVGGTEFNDTGNPSAYWSSANGYGLSSAIGTIPEGAWNDPLGGKSNPQPASTGGGVSSYVATPGWQAGTGVPAARSGRYTPDVSFSASSHDGYFGCFAAGGGSCVTGSSGSYQFEAFAGTSASAPSMAGIAALLDEAKGEPQGNLNPGLYKLAVNAPTAFHDVTVASSGVGSCSVNIPSMCNNSVPSATGLSGGQAGFLVTAGYDEATGLGSLDVQAFLNNYNAKLTPSVTVTPSPTSINVTQPLTVTILVNTPAGNPIPTGSVTLTGGSYASAATALTNGGATINLPAGSLGATSGTITLTARYTPDSASSPIYNSASGVGYVTMTKMAPTVTVTPNPSSVTTAQSLSVTVTVSAGAGSPTPTGSISLSGGNYYFSPATLVGGAVTLSIPAGFLAPGSDLLSAEYFPDAQSAPIYLNSFGSSNVTVTGTARLTPTVTVTPTSFNVVRANPLPVAVSVSGGAGNPTATGSVMLTGGGYSSATAILSNGGATFTIPGGTLAVGTDSIVAVYAPDAASAATYNNASGIASISVSDPVKSAPVVTVTPSSSTVTTAQPLPVTITLTGSSGYPNVTGTVILSGGGYTSAPATLSANSATITIPAGALSTGADSLTATYTPDAASSAIFIGASNSAFVTVTVPAAPSFTIAGSAVTVMPGATSGNISTITLTPSGGFTGNVALSATLTNSPANAQFPPSLSFGSTSAVSITGTAAGTASLTIATTASSSAALDPPRRPSAPWYGAGSAALACMVLFVPRRRWRKFLGMIALLLVCAGGITSCSSKIIGPGGGGGGNAGTTAGTYTITVTGASGTTTATGNITLIVQ